MSRSWPDSRLQELFGCAHPILQAGMVHNSGADLAAAAAEAGCLGLIAAGSYRPDEFRAQVRRARELTAKPVGVNIPLFFKYARESLETALAEGVPVIVTSAGSPKRAAGPILDAGRAWVHVAASPALAVKCQEAGCHAVVVEGFEAGGHNGREELTTMVLTPAAVAAVDIPVIAAGGIATGAQMAAALALGAAGVQIGSRFAVTRESAGHQAFKQAVVDGEDTLLVLKQLMPVRLLDNAFRRRVLEAEAAGAAKDELAALLGEGRARLGMAQGDVDDGELEIGQVAALIHDIPTAAEVVAALLEGYDAAVARLRGGP
ncbi:nitronate monooxygenase [bacterium]|nr:nitronate monooxygenase [bacterium]